MTFSVVVSLTCACQFGIYFYWLQASRAPVANWFWSLCFSRSPLKTWFHASYLLMENRGPAFLSRSSGLGPLKAAG